MPTERARKAAVAVERCYYTAHRHVDVTHDELADLIDRAAGIAELEMWQRRILDMLEMTTEDDGTPAEERIEAMRRELNQYAEVAGLSPLKYPAGRRLPDAELRQDPAFLAHCMGALEAERNALAQRLEAVIALHANRCPSDENFCDGCVNSYPCKTLRLARNGP